MARSAITGLRRGHDGKTATMHRRRVGLSVEDCIDSSPNGVKGGICAYLSLYDGCATNARKSWLAAVIEGRRSLTWPETT